MRTPKSSPDLERLVAEQLSALIDEAPIEAEIDADKSRPLQQSLELFVPQILRHEHPEWEAESIDGFQMCYFARTAHDAVVAFGACILISDQTLTPFWLRASISSDSTLELFRVRLGEPGRGPLGISGPTYGSAEGRAMLSTISHRINFVNWVYDASLEELDA